jgi:hypothetical protein
MASELIVVTAASCEKGTLPLYREQLAQAGIPFYLDDISSHYIPPLGGNFRIKIESMRRLSQQFLAYERIVFTDAFDVVFFGDKDSLLAKIPTDRVLWGAEKNCYPDPAIAERIEQRPGARFANGGLLCGSPRAMIEWTHSAESHPWYHPDSLDQQWLNAMVAEKSPLAQCDFCSRIFFCLFGGYPELEFERGVPVNTMFQTHPQFVHANGHWDTTEMWRKWKESLL